LRWFSAISAATRFICTKHPWVSAHVDHHLAVLGFKPVTRALANSNVATVEIAGPSHNSARAAVRVRSRLHGPRTHPLRESRRQHADAALF
jgi:hypothetical protein